MNKMLLEKLKEVIEVLESASKDAEKFDRGVDAPGTRLRKTATEASKLLKELRQVVLDVRKERKG
tara:strand:- start:180 stop:374 length:195 start_codon:yes stop_codon:yes gene_type:complete